MNKYTVLLDGESPFSVFAERMQLLDGALTLYVDDEIKAFYPRVVGFEVDLPPKPAPCPPAELRSGSVAGAAFLEPWPTISIGSIYLAAGPGADVKTVLDELIELARNASRGGA